MNNSFPLGWIFITERNNCELPIINYWMSIRHSGAEGILGEVVSPIQVSYLSESVSTSRFRICRTLNISSGSEWEIIFFCVFLFQWITDSDRKCCFWDMAFHAILLLLGSLESTKYLNSYIFRTGSSRHFRKGGTLVQAELNFTEGAFSTTVSSSPLAAPRPSGKAVMHSPSPSQFSHQPSLLASSVTQFLEAGWSIVNNVQHSYLAAGLHAFLRHCSAKACSLIEGLKVLYQEHKRFLVHASANQVMM